MKLSMNIFSIAIIFSLANLFGCGGNVKTQQAVSEDIIIWNGESKPNGRGYANANNEEVDSSIFSIDYESGYKSNSSLKLQFAGADWMGFGWNWLDLWDTTSGQDISQYRSLSFQMKVSGTKLPHPSKVVLQLGSAGEPKGRSSNVSINEFAEGNILNGEWHKIEIPLSRFANTKAPGRGMINMKRARIFNLGVDPQKYVDFDINLDDIMIVK